MNKRQEKKNDYYNKFILNESQNFELNYLIEYHKGWSKLYHMLSFDRQLLSLEIDLFQRHELYRLELFKQKL